MFFDNEAIPREYTIDPPMYIQPGNPCKCFKYFSFQAKITARISRLIFFSCIYYYYCYNYYNYFNSIIILDPLDVYQLLFLFVWTTKYIPGKLSCLCLYQAFRKQGRMGELCQGVPSLLSEGVLLILKFRKIFRFIKMFEDMSSQFTAMQNIFVFKWNCSFYYMELQDIIVFVFFVILITCISG